MTTKTDESLEIARNSENVCANPAENDKNHEIACKMGKDDDADCELYAKHLKKKKLSLTLPLLNVVVTDTTNTNEDLGDELSQHSKKESINTSSVNKKIYETDDNFIQTIFSQTIKSTTATPTDDEPQSYSFDDLKELGQSSQTSQNQNCTQKNAGPIGKVETAADPTSKRPDVVRCETKQKTVMTKVLSESTNGSEDLSNQDDPVDMFTYFHQTIDEDELPYVVDFIEPDSKTESSNPPVDKSIPLCSNPVTDIFNSSTNISLISSNGELTIDVSLILFVLIILHRRVGL